MAGLYHTGIVDVRMMMMTFMVGGWRRSGPSAVAGCRRRRFAVDFFPPFLPIIAPFPAIFVIASYRHRRSSIFPPLLLVSHILDMSENNASEFPRRNSYNLSHPDIFVLNSPMERNKLLEKPADTRSIRSPKAVVLCDVWAKTRKIGYVKKLNGVVLDDDKDEQQSIACGLWSSSSRS